MKIPKYANFLSYVLMLSTVWAGHETNAPMVYNISYAQRVDENGSLTKMVDIEYVLEGNRSMFVEFFFSPDGGQSFPVICTAVTGDAGPGVEPSQVVDVYDPNSPVSLDMER